MTHELLPRSGGLLVPEVLRRVAPAFRQVVIDWIAGDEHQAAVAQKARDLGVGDMLAPAPEVGGVVFIQLADEQGEDHALRFQMRAGGSSAEILVGYVSADHERGCRQALHKLAELLDCEVGESEWD